MDYETGWNDAQLQCVLTILQFKEEFTTQALARGGEVVKQLESTRKVIDLIANVLTELRPVEKK